jgi:hypothetical protein
VTFKESFIALKSLDHTIFMSSGVNTNKLFFLVKQGFFLLVILILIFAIKLGHINVQTIFSYATYTQA